MTLQDEWQKYKQACYPQGITANQNRECHQAFFAGALVALQSVKTIANALPEGHAAAAVGALMMEAELVTGAHVANLKKRN